MPSTRKRLVDAVIEIVRGEGLGALTTVAITRRAGIAQPGFYKHFRNVDECLEEATKQVLDGMRETFGAMRRRIRDRTDPEEVAEHFRAVLDAVAMDPSFNELIVRYRRDPSALGCAIREAEARVGADFVEELWGQARNIGLLPEHRDGILRLTELIRGALSGCVERVLDDPGADRATMARYLAEFSVAGTRALLGRLLGKSASRQGERRGPS